jgi:exodeoxyribonuclease VII large subunit
MFIVPPVLGLVGAAFYGADPARARRLHAMDLFEDARPGENAPEFTVSDLAGAVRRVIEGEFGRVRVRGEVGRVSRPASGHVYFDLKDDRACIGGIVWRSGVQGLQVQPQEGMEVIATGRMTTHAGASKYQIVVESLAPAGVGALMAMLDARRKALEAEGLFAAERKRRLPYLPETIGVITSPSGAVIRDILHRLRERFPRPVLLWPVTVQGPNCAAEVAAAIRGFNSLAPGGAVARPDVLIVARGGGSLEDLWGFNEEIVVRAAAESRIPLISAVGHETDTTLIDHAADRRAPTPTAAAEIAVPVRLDLLAALARLEERRHSAASRGTGARAQRLRDLGRALPRPDALVAERTQRLDGLSLRLPRALTAFVRERRLALGRGPAGRFGPGLLAIGVSRQRQRLVRAETGVRPEVIAARIDRLEERLATRGAGLERVERRLTADKRAHLEALARTLATLGPQAVLARGYAVVRDTAGTVLTSAEVARGAAALDVEFADGRVTARPERRTARRSAPSDPAQGQGRLF